MNENGTEAKPRDPRRTFMFWFAPTLAVALLTIFFGGAYLAGNVNPRENLHDFPVAIVNADRGADTVDGSHLNAGDKVVDGLVEGIDPNQFDLRHLTGQEAIDQMSKGELYGAIVIPENFSSRLNAWGIGTMVGNDVVAPDIRIISNPAAGLGAQTIVKEMGFQVGDRVDDAVGKQLREKVQAAIDEAPEGAPSPTGTALAAAARPVNVKFEDFHPLPDGTGNGLSAFYWTLLIVLAGFTGAMLTSQIVDNRLGIHSLEWGPFFVRHTHHGVSRLGTLVAKFGMSATQAALVAALYVLIGTIVGMPLGSPFALWGFTAAMILAVGWVSHAIIALLGNPGLVVNLVAFIVLGLPSAGGTLPLEAVPEVFRVISLVSPMHQIYLGSRSMLYFGGTWDSGVGQALAYAGISLVGAVIVGVAAAVLYDRKGWHRAPAPA
ncbi:YhgE/Pip domain-containing protein [Corynebacterium hansenii]|uniref:YhgE/Pip domain-containing protein n=1 Tax=Corynebacterium hansenii TaxID=394964 RepID=A0ABV7ZSB2_9CORY|nr:ABC transporter permease [Corynebacterium hansenii]WJZ00912.1 ABC-2 family transporter protein [Corynebacterium hansenii]